MFVKGLSVPEITIFFKRINITNIRIHKARKFELFCFVIDVNDIGNIEQIRDFIFSHNKMVENCSFHIKRGIDIVKNVKERKVKSVEEALKIFNNITDEKKKTLLGAQTSTKKYHIVPQAYIKKLFVGKHSISRIDGLNFEKDINLINNLLVVPSSESMEK